MNIKQPIQLDHFVKEDKPDMASKEYNSLITYGNPPEIEDVVFHDDLYEKDLQEWNRKNVKPDYDWVVYSDRKPDKGQYVYWNIGIGFKAERMQEDIFSSVRESDMWCDKLEHDNKVQYYNDHQVIFEGFKKVNECTVTDSSGLEVTFISDHVVVSRSNNIIYNGPCDVDLMNKLIEIN